MRSKVAIADNGPGRQSVVINGHDISRAVSGVTIEVEAGRLPEVELTLAIPDLAPFEAKEARVEISSDVRDALIKLGWTPPGRDDIDGMSATGR